MPRPQLGQKAGNGASWSSTRAARMAATKPFSSPISQMVRRVSIEEAKVPISPISLRRLSDFIEMSEPESSSATFTGAFEHCMDALQKTRRQRERQRAIQLAVISKLKTLQKRREMLKVCVRKWCQRARESVRIARLNARIGEARKRRREELYARERVVHEKPVYVRGKRAVARGF
jgi:hypothetical protein